MPVSKSAQKRVRQNEKRRRRNRSWKTQVKNNLQEIDDAIEDGVEEEDLLELKREAISTLTERFQKRSTTPTKGTE